jgi:1-deoxy-D-xylulose-5-phosphate reductoisomerase
LPIKWAYQALKEPNSSLSIVINAANEELINFFKLNQVKFTDITKAINKCILHFRKLSVNSLDDVFIIDKKVREYVQKLY